MIFETHAHYDDDKFNEDRETLLRSLPEEGVGVVINSGASVESTRDTIRLAKEYAHVYAAVGVHPSEISELDETFIDWMREQASWEKTVAIGEIGLDYYWDKEPEVQERQRYWFGRQIELAREVGLPIIVHSRDAAADTMQVMKEHHAEEIPGVIHCFSYSKEMALEFIKMGYYIGVGGVVTFKNAKKLIETVEAIPLERILLETDCPYMAPEPAACPKLTKGRFEYDFGDVAGYTPLLPMYTLGHQFIPANIHSGGLRYHGAGVIVSQLLKDGFIEATDIAQTEAFKAGCLFAETEGIIPAPESCHAIAATITEALKCKESGEAKAILFCLSGHGLIDMTSYDQFLSGNMRDYTGQ